MPRPTRHVFVCTQNRPPNHPRGSCGGGHGSAALLQAFWAEQQKRQAYDTVAIAYAGCLVYPEAVLYSGVTPADVDEIFSSHLERGEPVARLLAPREIW